MGAFSWETGKKILLGLLYAVGAVVLLYVSFRFLFPAVLPFLLAFAMAAILQKPVRFLEEKCRCPKKLSSVILVLAVLGLLVWILSLTAEVLFRELGEFAEGLAATDSEGQKSLAALVDFAGRFLDRVLGFFSPGLAENTDTAGIMKNAVLDLLSGMAAAIPGIFARTAAVVPGCFLFLAALVLSGIYFCADYDAIRKGIGSLFSGRWKSATSHLKKEGFQTLARLCRAYAFLFLLTFAELLLGFWILRQRYALLFAFVIAFVDILPVLGTGTVLIPWAIALFLTGNSGRGLSFLILYLVIMVVRQILEPRVVGGGIGLPPALALMGMYMGLKLAGIPGMIGLPVVLAVGKNLLVPKPGAERRTA